MKIYRTTVPESAEIEGEYQERDGYTEEDSCPQMLVVQNGGKSDYNLVLFSELSPFSELLVVEPYYVQAARNDRSPHDDQSDEPLRKTFLASSYQID